MAHIYPTMNACQHVLCAETGTDADEPDSCHGEERDYMNMVIFGEEGELVRRKGGVERFGESHWACWGGECECARMQRQSRPRPTRRGACICFRGSICCSVSRQQIEFHHRIPAAALLVSPLLSPRSSTRPSTWHSS